MSAVATAIVVAAGVSYYASEQSAKASEKAAYAMAGSADSSNAELARQYDQTRADMAPWRDTGEQALYSLADLMGQERTVTKTRDIPQSVQNQINDLNNQIASWTAEVELTKKDPSRGQWQPKQEVVNNLIAARDKLYQGYQYEEAVPKSDKFGYLTKTFTTDDFYKDPGYEFRLTEGNKAIDRASAARGGFFSGRAGKELTRYGQDYASNEFNNAYNRFTQDQSNLYNRYAGMSGTGQTTAQQMGQMGQNYANQYGQNTMYAGNAMAQDYQNAAAQRTSGYTNMANAVNSGVSNYMLYDYLNKKSA